MAFLIHNLEMFLKASDSPRPFGPAELVFRNISKLRIKNPILAHSVAFFAHQVAHLDNSVDFCFARWTSFSTQSGFSFCANGIDHYLCEVE